MLLGLRFFFFYIFLYFRSHYYFSYLVRLVGTGGRGKRSEDVINRDSGRVASRAIISHRVEIHNPSGEKRGRRSSSWRSLGMLSVRWSASSDFFQLSLLLPLPSRLSYYILFHFIYHLLSFLYSSFPSLSLSLVLFLFFLSFCTTRLSFSPFQHRSVIIFFLYSCFLFIPHYFTHPDDISISMARSTLASIVPLIVFQLSTKSHIKPRWNLLDTPKTSWKNLYAEQSPLEINGELPNGEKLSINSQRESGYGRRL